MSVHKELNRIQKNLKVPKSNVNNFGKYKFRSAQDILEAIKPHLGECYLLTPSYPTTINGTRHIEVTAILGLNDQTISATAHAEHPENKKGMDPSQVSGATTSYAKKYALENLFAIDNSDDADVTNKHEKDDSEFKIKAHYFSLLKEFYGEEVPKEEIEDAKKMSMEKMRSMIGELEAELIERRRIENG